jgi:tRNA(Ile)-lysidine synthase
MRHHPAVAAIRQSVRTALVESRLGAGDLVLAAVSGGADSLALAASLGHVGPALGLRAGAVTVDHGLQTGSAERGDEVAAECRRLGLDPVVVRRVTVGPRGGPEAAARTARYDAVATVAADTGAALVLLGHTLDDQAETVLLGLARGSGARSLSGMPRRHDRYLRPLLDIRREQTAEACRALGLEPWADPHNTDPAYARARVRSAAMPALEQALGPGVAEALARTARLLRDDADALDQWADAVQPGLSVTDLAALPPAVRRRVLRRAAVLAGSPAGSLTAGHVLALDRLVTDWHGQHSVALPGGLVGERRYDRLSFR